MRTTLRRWLAACYRRLTPQKPLERPDARLVLAAQQLAEARAQEQRQQAGFLEFVQEMVEARRMFGAGPWKQSKKDMQDGARLMRVAEAVAGVRQMDDVALEEAQLPGAVGAFGDIELALQNVEWRREINFSWLEFTRWGIQQIILISRLYYIKNPICRRLVDVCAAYVFARGVEVTTSDEAANDVLRDFFERNKQTFGHVGLLRQERAKDLDGNVFWVFFADFSDKGKVNCRTIDPVEMDEIICDPNDADTEKWYKRCWIEQVFDEKTGSISTTAKTAWYPSIKYRMEYAGTPPATIGADPVMWDSPVYHRKCGDVGKWRFGCPRIYPMLDWAKEARRYLESCGSVAQSLARITLLITTKGGQQALEGMKQQLETTVGPSAQIWDTNPAPDTGAVFGSGPGTKLESFKTQGAGLDPEKVRRMLLMCCMVKGVPETFLADVSTGNLATATSLDRPTETVFLSLQEEWQEDLTTISKVVLLISGKAPSGRLQEALRKLGDEAVANLTVLECRKRRTKSGRIVYEAFKAKKDAGEIEIKVNFPAIREGDVPALVKATVESMTLDNKGGQVVGIDEKAGVIALYDLLGMEQGDELAEEQYPESEYDPDRTVEPLPAPIGKAVDAPGGAPQNPGGQQKAPTELQPKEVFASLKASTRRIARALRILEAETADNER